MLEGPIYWIWQGTFISTSLYLIFGERERERKDSLGKFTDSKFAEHLLHPRADREPSLGGDELPLYDLGVLMLQV